MEWFTAFSVALVMALAPVPAVSADHGDPRVVTVSGRGEVAVEPDRARVSLAIMSRADQQRVAQDEVDRIVDAVLRLVDDLDIPRKHVNTTGLTVMPEYRWDQDDNERRLAGYMVQRSVEVNLEDLTKLGRLMHEATTAGVNQVSPPVLEASDADEHRRRALARAAEDARLNADVLARTLDAKLGAVRRITSSDVMHHPPPRPMMESRAMAMDAKAAEETYNAAEIRFEASITAEFDLD